MTTALTAHQSRLKSKPVQNLSLPPLLLLLRPSDRVVRVQLMSVAAAKEVSYCSQSAASPWARFRIYAPICCWMCIHIEALEGESSNVWAGLKLPWIDLCGIVGSRKQYHGLHVRRCNNIVLKAMQSASQVVTSSINLAKLWKLQRQKQQGV